MPALKVKDKGEWITIDNGVSASGILEESKSYTDTKLKDIITEEQCNELNILLNTDMDTTDPYKTLLETIVANQQTLAEQVNSLDNDTSYGPGSTFDMRFYTAGVLTGSALLVRFSIPLSHQVKNVTNITISNMECKIRQNGYYILGSSQEYGVPANTTFTLTDNFINVELTLAEAHANAVNNHTCAIAINGTLNFE